MKKHVKEFFDKAVNKHEKYEQEKAKRAALKKTKNLTQSSSADLKKEESEADETMANSDEDISKDEQVTITPITPLDQMTNGGVKRKREADLGDGGTEMEDDEATQSKRARSDTPPTPPPPPPPPIDTPTAEDELWPVQETDDGNGFLEQEDSQARFIQEVDMETDLGSYQTNTSMNGNDDARTDNANLSGMHPERLRMLEAQGEA